ncbi:hypothetical protein TNCV_4892561 [Trichonephila clavipes]|nr:hypothetical protein TNCV_4892561 [Trichonephila clavipes]
MNSANNDKEGECSNSGDKRDDIKPKDSLQEPEETAWNSRIYKKPHLNEESHNYRYFSILIGSLNGGVGTSGQKRRHLHGYKSHCTLHRSVVKKTTHTSRANSFMGRCPDLGSLFTTGPCVFSNYRKTPGRGTSGITVPITSSANNTYSPTPPFGVVSRTTGWDCNGMEPGRLLRRII